MTALIKSDIENKCLFLMFDVLMFDPCKSDKN